MTVNASGNGKLSATITVRVKITVPAQEIVDNEYNNIIGVLCSIITMWTRNPRTNMPPTNIAT